MGDVADELVDAYYDQHPYFDEESGTIQYGTEHEAGVSPHINLEHEDDMPPYPHDDRDNRRDDRRDTRRDERSSSRNDSRDSRRPPDDRPPPRDDDRGGPPPDRRDDRRGSSRGDERDQRDERDDDGPLMPECEVPVRHTARKFGWTSGKAASGVKYEQVGLRLVITDGEYKGRSLLYYGTMHPNAEEFTCKAMKAVGWLGGDPTDDRNWSDAQATAVIRHETYNGRTRARVAFINGSDVVMQTEMTRGEARQFASRFRETFAKYGPGGGRGQPQREERGGDPRDERRAAPRDERRADPRDERRAPPRDDRRDDPRDLPNRQGRPDDDDIPF